MIKPPTNTNEFKALVEIVGHLRGPEGCPWDKEQTHQTLTPFAIEETYELIEAIDRKKDDEIKEELGDLLLQVVLHAEVAKQRGAFEISDVIESISKKMIRRHPHVFSDTKALNSKEVLSRWDQIKETEKTTQSKNPFARLPKELPALIRSQKMGAKTVRFNFDWENHKEVLKKVDEELSELKEAIESQNEHNIHHELGDLLFSVAQLARHLKTDAEQSLRECNIRFEKRFLTMRELAESDGHKFSELSSSELESYWQKSKKLQQE